MIGAVPALAAAPPNDLFQNGILVSGVSVSLTGDNRGATTEAGEPMHHGVQGGASVWWRSRAPRDADVRVNTDGSGFHPARGVPDGGFGFVLNGPPGRTSERQVSSDLLHWGTWKSVDITAPVLPVSDTPPAGADRRWYRARLLP